MASKYHLALSSFLVACFFVTLFIQSLHGHDGDSALTSLISDMGRSFHGCDQDLKLKKADCENRGLGSVPQDLSEDIEKLDLHENKITTLLNSSFKVYPLITYLDISFNDLREIESAAFYPLRDLMYLYLYLNPRLVLPATGVFMMSTKLSILDLRSSNLKSLPNDTLKWSPQLKAVYVTFNQFSFINISSCGTIDFVSMTGIKLEYLTMEYFNFVCKTDTLQFIANPIRYVDPSVIASLHVRELVLGDPLSKDVLENILIGISESQIKHLTILEGFVGAFPQGFFDPLRHSSLSVLDFIFNDLNGLYPFVFSNLTRLEQLSFTGNKHPIDKIQPDFFEGMKKLRILKIYANDIRQINPQNQIWTVDLIEFYVSSNLLTEISPFAFLGLQNLTFLDMSSNEYLSVFKLTALSGLNNIQHIVLTGTRLMILQLYTSTLRSLSLNSIPSSYSLFLIPGESFKHSRSLVHLEMQDSRLRLFYLWNADANVSLFDGLFKLNHLDLSSNPYLSFYGDIPPGIFRQLSALKELRLDNCDIANLHPLIFMGLESLQNLGLRGNNLQRLPGDILIGLGLIESINFEGNIIAYLEETLFSNNLKLTNLSLANNRLTWFNESTFTSIVSSLKSLDLSRNPINCNCDLKWLLDWLNGPIHLIDKDKTLCSSASLEPIREKPLLDFNPNELCWVNNGLFSLIPLGFICLIVIIVLVYHNRWRLRYKVFLLKLAVIGYKEIRDAREQDDYQFDVNIIFYDEDEEWIREYLRPALEERLPQFRRNVFGDADLVAGMHYLESVDYVVSHSYKTIVVLSRAAVHDHWFMLKFRTAMDHVSDTLTEFVVVVFLEDIPGDEMPFLARLYLSDGRPYIDWTEDVRGQEYFWNKLIKTLTINLRTNDLIPNE